MDTLVYRRFTTQWSHLAFTLNWLVSSSWWNMLTQMVWCDWTVRFYLAAIFPCLTRVRLGPQNVSGDLLQLDLWQNSYLLCGMQVWWLICHQTVEYANWRQGNCETWHDKLSGAGTYELKALERICAVCLCCCRYMLPTTVKEYMSYHWTFVLQPVLLFLRNCSGCIF